MIEPENIDAAFARQQADAESEAAIQQEIDTAASPVEGLARADSVLGIIARVDRSIDYATRQVSGADSHQEFRQTVFDLASDLMGHASALHVQLFFDEEPHPPERIGAAQERKQDAPAAIQPEEDAMVIGYPDTPLWKSARLPPTNDRAEAALLGALLTNNLAYGRVRDFLLADHFSDPVHGRIYQAVGRRVEAGQIADVVTLRAEFDHSGVLDEVGGARYLAQLVTGTSIIDVREYATCIADAWIRRQMVDLTGRMACRAERSLAYAFGEGREGEAVPDGYQIVTSLREATITFLEELNELRGTILFVPHEESPASPADEIPLN